MSATHTMNLGKANGQDITRGSEATKALVEEFVLITDPEDRLYCPGVDDEPSAALIQSIRNGWQKGETLKCVNRGKKGGALVLVVADGRSRVKATRIVNVEREAEGLTPIRPEFVLLTEDEAYEVMHTSHNKQERKPSFDARCWGQYKRVFAKNLGGSSLDDSQLRDARKAYADLRKCSVGQVKTWELILSAHPDVLAMFDDGEFKKATLLDIVNSTAYADQPEAARKIAAMAKARKEDALVPEPVMIEVQKTHFAGDACLPAHEEPKIDEPKASRGTRSERADRRAALGIDQGPKPISAKRLELLLTQLSMHDADLVDPCAMIAFVLGRSEYDGLPLADHPSMGEVVKKARTVGIEVAK